MNMIEIQQAYIARVALAHAKITPRTRGDRHFSKGITMTNTTGKATIQQQHQAFNTLDMKRTYEATHVTVKNPASGKWVFAEGSGLMSITLDTGDYVWVGASYAHDLTDCPEIKQVGDGRNSGYDIHGNCVLSVPATWCTFYSQEEAECIERAYDADMQMLSYAR